MKKLIIFLLATILMLALVSCNSSEKAKNEIEEQSSADAPQSGSFDENPSSSSTDSEKSDTEKLREWIEYAEGTKIFDDYSAPYFFHYLVESTSSSGVNPVLACNYIYHSGKTKDFPETFDTDTKIYPELNASIATAPTVMLDSEIFENASGEYAYVFFNLVDLKGYHTIAVQKITDVKIENECITLSADVYRTPEGRGSEREASFLLMKFKAEDVLNKISSLEVVANRISYEMLITEDDGCEDFRPYPHDDYVPYIEAVFNNKVEKGSWSDALEFDCTYEFNGRSVLVNFTDLIFSENGKVYALDAKIAEFIFNVSKEKVFAKPVIYLYPEKDMLCSVELDFDGELTCTYPDYSEGWNDFIARPNGTLVFPDGKEYYALYWEGKSSSMIPNLSRGTCVKGSDSAQFLESALSELGLNAREANEFIIYWLPILEANEYNVITFQTDAYEEVAALNVTPAPDSVLRVYMYAYATDKYIEMQPQEFEPFERVGFTVVEWGGTMLNK